LPQLFLQVMYDAADPASAPLPSPWSSKLDAFQRLLLLRVLRPDKLTTAISEFVKHAIGARFVEPPPLDIDRCFKDSSATTPLIFVLSPGSDPMSMLLKYAEGLKVQVRMLIRHLEPFDAPERHRCSWTNLPVLLCCAVQT
jgi:dynein heavy chain